MNLINQFINLFPKDEYEQIPITELEKIRKKLALKNRETFSIEKESKDFNWFDKVFNYVEYKYTHDGSFSVSKNEYKYTVEMYFRQQKNILKQTIRQRKTLIYYIRKQLKDMKKNEFTCHIRLVSHTLAEFMDDYDICIDSQNIESTYGNNDQPFCESIHHADIDMLQATLYQMIFKV